MILKHTEGQNARLIIAVRQKVSPTQNPVKTRTVAVGCPSVKHTGNDRHQPKIQSKHGHLYGLLGPSRIIDWKSVTNLKIQSKHGLVAVGSLSVKHTGKVSPTQNPVKNTVWSLLGPSRIIDWKKYHQPKIQSKTSDGLGPPANDREKCFIALNCRT